MSLGLLHGLSRHGFRITANRIRNNLEVPALAATIRGAAGEEREMKSCDLYERYFGPESRTEQAALFSNVAEVRDYVVYQITEHYPEDTGREDSIADQLWNYFQN